MAAIIGTTGPDELVSLSNGDVVTGLEGNDILTTLHDNVTLSGGPGVDVLESSAVADNTTMDGGRGTDDLIGFGTNDTASYANDPAGVTVDLSARIATDGYGDLDVLFGIEKVTGSAFADSLTGDDSANVLTGGAGDDTLTGGDGADVFQYSFDLAQGGVSETFTDFIEQDGAELTDNLYTQGFFSSQYTAWLQHLVETFNLGSDVGGDGIVEVGLNQNDAALDATPFIEGMSADDLTAIFTGRDCVVINTGKVTQDRFYSNSFSTDDGQNPVTSMDGFDAIVDFTFGEGGDKLEFSGLGDLTLEQFTNLFAVNDVDTDGLDGPDSTMLVFADSTPDDIDWGVTVQGSGHTIDEFYASTIFS